MIIIAVNVKNGRIVGLHFNVAQVPVFIIFVCRISWDCEYFLPDRFGRPAITRSVKMCSDQSINSLGIGWIN